MNFHFKKIEDNKAADEFIKLDKHKICLIKLKCLIPDLYCYIYIYLYIYHLIIAFYDNTIKKIYIPHQIMQKIASLN